MNLIKKLRELFTEKVEVPEVKFRVRVLHKHKEVVAEVFESNRWNKIKVCETGVVSHETAIERCKAAIEAYKTLNVNDKGEVSL